MRFCPPVSMVRSITCGLVKGKLLGEARFDEALGDEAQPLLLQRIEAIDGVGQAHQALRREQIDLPDEIEHRIVAPQRIGEAAIPVGGRGRGQAVGLSARLRKEALPDGQPLAGHVRLDLGDTLDIGGRGQRDVEAMRMRRSFGEHAAALEDHLLGEADDVRPVLHLTKRRHIQLIVRCFGHAGHSLAVPDRSAASRCERKGAPGKN